MRTGAATDKFVSEAYTSSTENLDLLWNKGIVLSRIAHQSFICTTAECTFYQLTVWPATKASPEEIETKRRTSKLPIKTMNSLYFVCQFPVGSMSRLSPWYSSPLLFKSLSFTSSEQLHTIKNHGMRLEWSKSQLVRAGSSSKVLFSPLQVPYNQRKVSILSLQSTAACGVFDCLHEWLRILQHCKEHPTSIFNQDVLPCPITTGHIHSLRLGPCSSSAPTGYMVHTKTPSSNYICFNLGLSGRALWSKQLKLKCSKRLC